jgi:hypothetical protein
VSRPAQNAEVRNHKVSYPNRRPLLISAILVALTSIPTMIVVAAGTVSLHGHHAAPPSLAGPPAGVGPNGPIVVEPHTSSGLGVPPPAAGRAIRTSPPVHQPSPGSGAGGGTGQGINAGKPVPAPKQPTPARPPATGSNGGENTGTTGNGSTGTTANGGSTSANSGSSGSPPEDCPSPTPAPAPGGKSTGGSSGPASGGDRIDDDAWPGWDAHLTGFEESTRPHRHHPPAL